MDFFDQILAALGLTSDNEQDVDATALELAKRGVEPETLAAGQTVFEPFQQQQPSPAPSAGAIAPRQAVDLITPFMNSMQQRQQSIAQTAQQPLFGGF